MKAGSTLTVYGLGPVGYADVCSLNGWALDAPESSDRSGRYAGNVVLENILKKLRLLYPRCCE
jgi:hypothetical protein